MPRVTSAMLAKNFKSTFLSCEKDQEKIWKALFIDSRPYSDILKRLLIVNTPDCLDTSQKQYQIAIDSKDLKALRDEGYIGVTPQLIFNEHEQVKSYIILEFDDFFPSANPSYRNCSVSFTIVCHLDCWELDDYKLRPHQIAGYIDGILNKSKLSGIGELNFVGATTFALDDKLGGILLKYSATHGNEDEEHINPNMPSVQEQGVINTKLDVPNSPPDYLY